MKTRIIIADSHPLLRLGIRSCLKQAGDIEIVGETDSREELMQLTLELKPDVLLLEIATFGKKCCEVVKDIRKLDTSVKILALTAEAGKHSVISALCAGVDGYVLKNEDLDSIPLAIRSVIKGKQWISSSISHFLIDRIKSPHPTQPTNMFSEQDLEILRHVAEGLSNSEISLLISRAERTVEHHLSTIFKLLEVHTRTEAAVWAREHGMI